MGMSLLTERLIMGKDDLKSISSSPSKIRPFYKIHDCLITFNLRQNITFVFSITFPINSIILP